MRYAEITGWGKALPPTVLSNADLEQLVDTSDEWITSRSGIKERRISHVPASDMAELAARRAIAAAGVEMEDIDLVINATCTPESIIPASASYVQAKLGAANAGAMDLNANCSGFVYSYVTADALVRAGVAETVVLVGVERLSWVLDYTDRATCILFGDAGGAVLLEAAQDGEGILGFNNQVDGSGCDLLKMPAGGSIRPPTHETVERKEHYLQQQGKAVFRFAVRNSADAAEKLLAELGFSRDEVSFLVCHQANARIIDAVARRLQLPPERVVKTIHKYGNTTAASIPTALRDALDRSLLAPGDLVLFSSVGAGLTIGTAAIRWGGERTAPASAETNSTGP